MKALQGAVHGFAQAFQVDFHSGTHRDGQSPLAGKNLNLDVMFALQSAEHPIMTAAVEGAHPP